MRARLRGRLGSIGRGAELEIEVKMEGIKSGKRTRARILKQWAKEWMTFCPLEFMDGRSAEARFNLKCILLS